MLLVGVVAVAYVLALWRFYPWRELAGGVPPRETAHPIECVFAERLRHVAHPLETAVKMFRDQDDRPGVVALVRGLDAGFSLRSTGRATGDVEVGHGRFDDRFNVRGETATVRARFDASTREALLELVRHPLSDGQLTIADGELRAVLPQGRRESLSDPVGAAFPLLGRIALRLAEPLDVAAALAQNARQDPVSGVRRLCLRALLSAHGPSEIVDGVLRDAAADPDPEVRVEAATAWGDEGVAVLHALVSDASVEDEPAARAVAALGPRMSPSVARAALVHELSNATRSRRTATAIACIAALGERGDAADEAMLRAVAVEQRHGGLRLAALRALGRTGSASTVPALSDIAKKASGEIHLAARAAIASIQSRLHGATPGQLSLHVGGGGQVSLTDGADGRLSDASAEDGRR